MLYQLATPSAATLLLITSPDNIPALGTLTFLAHSWDLLLFCAIVFYYRLSSTVAKPLTPAMCVLKFRV